MSHQPADAPRLPMSRAGWTRLMDRLSIRPRKSLGQNFLFDRRVVERIVQAAEIAPGDRVVEVGPGLGILTEALLQAGAEVYAIELDSRLAAHLRETFGDDPRLHLVEGNVLAIDPAEVVPPDRPYAVAANLPYSVASAVLMHFLESSRPPRRLTVMVQREVAERIVARPPAMTILGVAAQFFTVPRIAFRVPPSVFVPPPKVESAVVVLDVKEELPLPPEDRARFFRVVNAGFRHKRKQLVNSLADELGAAKDEIAAWLAEAGIAPTRRAETLTVEEWVALVRAAPDWVAAR